ncbi:MAG: YncE family protein [Candidatus Neomarinimicrobiota bacterium]|jgi:DNA-binding beta-propeller fold protein YncE
MKARKMTVLLIASIILLLLNGCWIDPTGPAAGVASNEAVYVLNSYSSTISVIDVEEDSVYNDVALTGKWSNHLSLYEGKLYCVNSGSNNISIYNTADMKMEAPIDLGAGNNPMEMVIRDDIAYVTNLISAKVIKIDLATKTVIDSIDAGVGATAIALREDNIYVTNSGYDPVAYSYDPGTVSVIDINTEETFATIPVALNPQDIAVDALGYIHVLCSGDYYSKFAKVLKIDAQSNTVIDSLCLADGNSSGVIYIDKLSGVAYCGAWNKPSLSYDTNTMDVLNNEFSFEGASGFVTDDDGNIWISYVNLNSVYKYDEAGTILDSAKVGMGPQSLAYIKK